MNYMSETNVSELHIQYIILHFVKRLLINANQNSTF